MSPLQSSVSIMIVGLDPLAMGQLIDAVGNNIALPSVAVSFGQALNRALAERPQIILVEFDQGYQDALHLAPSLLAELGAVTLIAMARRGDPDRIRAAMRAGFREFVILPADAALLKSAISEASFAALDDEDRGQVIAVCGAKGGSGVTSLAVNLAAELCPVHKVLALDLDFSLGDVAAFLDLEPRSSVIDLLSKIDRVDEQVVAGSVSIHSSKLHVLPQPAELEESLEHTGERLIDLLTRCARIYQYCIMDCGSRLDAALLAAVTAADRILLVTTPDVPSVRNAHRRLKLFRRLGIEKERLNLLVQRYDKRTNKISREDIERNLGIPVTMTLPLDEKTALDAVNEGRLVREVNRRSPLAQSYSRLVSLVTEGELPPEEAEGRKGAMSWLFT